MCHKIGQILAAGGHFRLMQYFGLSTNVKLRDLCCLQCKPREHSGELERHTKPVLASSHKTIQYLHRDLCSIFLSTSASLL